jgi:hypothetical protein
MDKLNKKLSLSGFCILLRKKFAEINLKKIHCLMHETVRVNKERQDELTNEIMEIKDIVTLAVKYQIA